MKKYTKLLCLTLILLTLTACATPEKSLYDQGLEVAALLKELAGNKDCLQAYSASEAILTVIRDAVSGDYSQPSRVYSISIPADSIMQMPSGISQELESYMKQRGLAAVVSQINAMAGVETLAASSICTVGKTFVSSNAENILYLYTYPNTAPVLVTFTAGEDNTVSATGTFLLSSDFPTESPADIQSFFSEIPVSVTEITQ